MFAAARSRLGIFNRHTNPTIIALLILLVSQSQQSYAADCKRYKDRIEHYEQLRHGGGKARQMSHWQTTIDGLEEKLKQCNSNGRIQVAFGATPKRSTKATRHYIEAPAAVVTYTQSPAQKTADIIMVRKLKDCIKPNNFIDTDVSECMRGNLEPIWIK